MGPGKDFALGHEFVGVIAEVGEAVENFKVGDRVAAPAALHSGFDHNSRIGQPQASENGGIFGSGDRGLGGAMAEKILVKYADMNLSHIPDEVTDKQALAVGDIRSTGWTAVKEAITGPGQTIVIQGCGPIGLAAVMTAKLSGATTIIASDTIDERIAAAKELGATVVVNSMKENLVDVVMEHTDGYGADATVEAAGVAPTINAWPEILRHGGKVGMVAIPRGEVSLPVAQMVHKNISLWTGLGDLTKMDQLMSFIRKGVIDPTPVFTHDYAFDDIEKAIADVMDRKEGLIKPFIAV
ncbi:zinc-binding dehydrogenase [Corynebacterium breve]|uniref:Zinc-binding dehydrogenase n=1 Tax=Corynebacterium breve TaxID=3049799 RepID=A0ABY8VFG1_9CORY|nr:zinc-binding dehydrogenase [Corynebacterium breve]WIM67701.1 zinc-binding dehydrogenase [Corynebacterium breve]